MPGPALLLTYLGRVNSQAGREYERVVAVRAEGADQLQFMAESAEWLELMHQGKAVSTRDVWEQHFGNGWDSAIADARQFAARQFEPLAESFTRTRRSEIEKEKSELENWLSQRVEDLTGEKITREIQQELFGANKKDETLPAWLSIKNPRERLAAFVADRTRPPSRRSEADGVLRLYEQRSAVLKACLALNPPEVVPLGFLMLVPEKTGKEGRRHGA